MFSSSKNTESETLDSTRVINMMREFETFVKPYHQTYQSNHQSNTSRQFISVPNFDDTSITEDLIAYPASKILKLDVSPQFQSSPTSPKSATRISELRRKLLETERNLQHATATITSLKATALTIEPEAKMIGIEYEKKLELKNRECDSLKNNLLQLTNTKYLLEEQTAESLRKQQEEQEKLKSDLNKMTQRCKSLQSEKDELETELVKHKIDNSSTIKQLQNDLTRLRVELELLNDEKQQVELQSKNLMKQLQEKVVNETLKINSDLKTKISNLEAELKNREGKDQVVNAMTGDLKRLISLEKECSQLREDNKNLRLTRENTFLLKEKLSSAQEKLANIEVESSKSLELHVKIHDLQRKLENWETVASSPTAASGFIAQLQKSEIMHFEQIGKLKSELLSSKTYIIDLEGQIAVLKVNLKQANQNANTQSLNIKRLGRKLLLLSKECESYKRIITSYESEVSVDFDKISCNKVEALESLVLEYKETITNYENELKQSLHKFKLEEKNENELLLETEVKKLESQVRTLQCQVQEYESLREPQKNEQVFHFRKNPVAAAQHKREQEFVNLKETNEYLKARVQVLEKGNIANVTADAQELLKEQGGLSIDSLKEQLSLAEQKCKRMMEAFKKTSQEFREVNYLLTGFKIDMPSSKKFKLSHMYAESPHDCLLFEQTNDGKIQLLETDYSKCINHLIGDFLLKYDSIPLFLSNLTSELFYRQTSILDS